MPNIFGFSVERMQAWRGGAFALVLTPAKLEWLGTLVGSKKARTP